MTIKHQKRSSIRIHRNADTGFGVGLGLLFFLGQKIALIFYNDGIFTRDEENARQANGLT